MRNLFICLLMAVFIHVTQAPVYAAPAPIPVEQHLQSLVPEDGLALFSPELALANQELALMGVTLSGAVVLGTTLILFMALFNSGTVTPLLFFSSILLIPLSAVFLWALVVFPAMPYFAAGQYDNGWEHSLYATIVAVVVAALTFFILPKAGESPDLTGLPYLLLAGLVWLVGGISHISMLIHAFMTSNQESESGKESEEREKIKVKQR